MQQNCVNQHHSYACRKKKKKAKQPKDTLVIAVAILRGFQKAMCSWYKIPTFAFKTEEIIPA